MFPPKTQDSPMGGASESESLACPYCGKPIGFQKTQTEVEPKAQGPKNAAKMPMDQLKNVIKSGM